MGLALSTPMPRVRSNNEGEQTASIGATKRACAAGGVARAALMRPGQGERVGLPQRLGCFLISALLDSTR
jgi:hypothetical protein